MKGSRLMQPLMLWVLNLLIAILEHLVHGPGQVFGTPLQRIVSAILEPHAGKDNADEWAVWFLIATGILAVACAIPAIILDFRTSGGKI